MSLKFVKFVKFELPEDMKVVLVTEDVQVNAAAAPNHHGQLGAVARDRCREGRGGRRERRGRRRRRGGGGGGGGGGASGASLAHGVALVEDEEAAADIKGLDGGESLL